MKKEKLLNLMRKDSAGKTPDVFDSVISSARQKGLINAGQAANLCAAHASAGAGVGAVASAAGGSKIIISSLIAALAVTAAVGGTVGASLAVNGSNQANGGTAPPPVTENPNPPVNPENPNPPIIVVETEGLQFAEIEGGYAVKGKGTATDDEIVIPKMHQGKPVKEIAEKAFFGLNLTSVTIQDNIENIGAGGLGYGVQKFIVDENNARYCVKNNCIVDITEKILIAATTDGVIPTDGSVTVIGDYAFYNHRSDVAIPEGVVRLGKSAFESSEVGAIDGLNLPNSLKEIGERAFYGCHCIESELIFSSGVETIGRSAFEMCNSLESVAINQGLKYIGDSAFSRCQILRSVNLPVSLERIEGFVFFDCNALQYVNYEASEFVWQRVIRDSAWDWWKSTDENREMRLGDMFRCAPLGEMDVLGVVRFEVYSEGQANDVIINRIIFEPNGRVYMQNTLNGDGYAYIGTWTHEFLSDRLDKLHIRVEYQKYAMAGDIMSDVEEGTGSVTFEFWYEVLPDTICTYQHKCVRYFEGNDEFCNGSIVFSDL